MFEAKVFNFLTRNYKNRDWHMLDLKDDFLKSRLICQDLEIARKNSYTSKKEISKLESLKYYSGYGYQKVNKLLNSLLPIDHYDTCKKLITHIENIDSIMKPLKAFFFSFRIENHITKIKKGYYIVNKGYMSTTFNKDYIRKNYKKGSYILIIKLKPKNKAIYVNHIVKRNLEDELLIDRDSKFKITKIIGKILILEAE